MTPEQLYKETKAWADETFGADRDIKKILDHLQEEVNELIIAVEQNQKQWIPVHDVLMEVADVQLLLYSLTQRLGACFNNYQDALIIKFSVNKKRKWVDMGDGNMRHLPDNMEIIEP